MNVESERKIDFAPPCLTDEDIEGVVSVLKSGWITTGKKVKEFEALLTAYTSAATTVCVNSATAAMHIILSGLEIGPGDEVITTPYTFSATASVIHHTGAKIVMADVEPDSFNISSDEIEKKITAKTKAIIAVDIAGIPCDYSKIEKILLSKQKLFSPHKGTLQSSFDKPVIIGDSSHSLGAKYSGIHCGNIADFTAFSFHAVKNLTTAEGGAIQIKKNPRMSIPEVAELFRLYSLHGQDRDAWKKEKSGGWKYDIKLLGFKYNMTDIQASLGISQLKRYAKILSARKVLHERYLHNFKNDPMYILPPYDSLVMESSYHIFPVRIRGFNETKRNLVLNVMKEKNIAVNVHFIPLPLFTAYKNLGFDIINFPKAHAMYENMISLPLHIKLDVSDIDFICENLNESVSSILNSDRGAGMKNPLT